MVVKVIGVIAVVILVMLVVALLSGGKHGPRRHRGDNGRRDSGLGRATSTTRRAHRGAPMSWSPRVRKAALTTMSCVSVGLAR